VPYGEGTEAKERKGETMHYHCEVIMPPTEDIEGALQTILAPFDENHQAELGFWDWYVIGGRFAGEKLIAKYDRAKVEQFHQWLRNEGVTVSGLQFGKQELSPANQIPKVDAKWNEMFPSKDGQPMRCPIFRHSNDQLADGMDGTIPGNVCKLKDLPDMECYRVIIACPSYDTKNGTWTGSLKAEFMISEDAWNGVSWMRVDWDKKVSSALARHTDKLSGRNPEYLEAAKPNNNWLVVTIDYHS